jgi:hypothetical protein
MASTYEPIATTTLGSNQATISFTSISGSYTDLIIKASIRLAAAGYAAGLQFNSDTGSNYSFTEMWGDGSSAGSARDTNMVRAAIASNTAIGDTANIYGALTIHLNNYSNSTTYKTMIVRYDVANIATKAGVNLWRSTSAINRIDFVLSGSGGYYASGSTFTLYGIKAA